MADPFEVRMRFTSQLQHLNASVNSSQKAAHYALKYRDMDEDLHSCILEQLERNSMNNRANIMYFIEHLCATAQRENHLDFVRMMQRDILRVVDAVAPSDGTGAANVKVVRRVLSNLQAKNILLPETVLEIEGCLKERDTMPGGTALSPVSPTIGVGESTSGQAGGDVGSIGGGGIGGDGANGGTGTTGQMSTGTSSEHQKSQQLYTVGGGSADGPTTIPPPPSGPPRVDKRQIEQRIEEDRERHKRLRESIWAVGGDDETDGKGRRSTGTSGAVGGGGEFQRLWDEVSDIGEDDFLIAEEEALERKIAAEAA